MDMTVMVSRSTFFISVGLLITCQGKDCNPNEIGVAMLSCQEERVSLSDASRLNDTAQLCQALQKYSECIGPKIADCKGEALMAFNIIKEQYTGAPYNCHIVQTWPDDHPYSENDVNSQFHSNHDNHIVTNGPINNLAVSTLLSHTVTEKRKEEASPEADIKMADTNTLVNPLHDTDTSPNAAPSSHRFHPIFLTVTLMVFVMATFTASLLT